MLRIFGLTILHSLLAAAVCRESFADDTVRLTVVGRPAAPPGTR